MKLILKETASDAQRTLAEQVDRVNVLMYMQDALIMTGNDARDAAHRAGILTSIIAVMAGASSNHGSFVTHMAQQNFLAAAMVADTGNLNSMGHYIRFMRIYSDPETLNKLKEELNK